ncbi:MAG: HAD-IC family P-type ATPase [Planctomycetota bacterium]
MEGKRYVFGNRALLSGSRARLAPELEDAWARAEADGFSVVGLGEPGGMARTLFVLEEALRPGTPGILKDLLRNGAEVEVLSGDAPAPCALLARRLGIPIRAGLLPGEKEALVARAARERGPAAFLGDGVNDGPALARADVSAAMAGGTDVARAASDLVFLGEDLRPLPAVLSIARSTLGRIRFNLFWALAYNPLLLFLAASGRLSPVVCALAMSASSLLVTGTSLRPFPAPSPRPEETSSWRPSSTPSFSVS